MYSTRTIVLQILGFLMLCRSTNENACNGGASTNVICIPFHLTYFSARHLHHFGVGIQWNHGDDIDGKQCVFFTKILQVFDI